MQLEIRNLVRYDPYADELFVAADGEGSGFVPGVETRIMPDPFFGPTKSKFSITSNYIKHVFSTFVHEVVCHEKGVSLNPQP